MEVTGRILRKLSEAIQNETERRKSAEDFVDVIKLNERLFAVKLLAEYSRGDKEFNDLLFDITG